MLHKVTWKCEQNIVRTQLKEEWIVPKERDVAEWVAVKEGFI